MNRLRNKVIKSTGIFMLAFSLVSTMGIRPVRADDVSKPNLNVTYDSTTISGTQTTLTTVTGKVNQDIEVKYKVTPDSLAVSDVNVNKEIVLVLDTSGSMSTAISGSTSRLKALQTAANNFIDKFAATSNVKVGIATYSSEADFDRHSVGLTPSTDTTTLKGKINSLVANGGTNIGDGIRYGTKMLQDSTDTTAKKYLVLMSDGEPTYYSGNKSKPIGGYNYEFYTGTKFHTTEDSNLVIAGGGSSDPDGRSLLYANNMISKVKDLRYESYEIAYSSGSSATKMQSLATTAGGTFLSATDASAIDRVFSNIADEIKSEFVVQNVNFNFSLPDGVTYSGAMDNTTLNAGVYTSKLTNLSYKLDSTKTKYVADPFYITLKAQGNKGGSYILGDKFTLTYQGTNGNTVTKTFPQITYKVVDNNQPNLKVSYESTKLTESVTSTDAAIDGKVGQSIEVKYKITGDPIAVDAVPEDNTSKEIVLVLDTSGSMSTAITGSTSRLKALQDAANNFIDKFAAAKNVKVGIATYATEADFDKNSIGLTASTDTATLKAKINNLKANGNTNIGDGIRYATKMLQDSSNKTALKYLILMSDGEPTVYSGDKNNPINVTNKSYQFYTGTKFHVSEDPNNMVIAGNGSSDPDGRCLLYANNMMTEVKNSNLQSYEIAYSSGSSAAKMQSLATEAGGTFLSATDANSINTVFSKIADEINSQYVVQNVNYNFSLLDGVQYTGSMDGVTVNGANYTKVLPNITYKLNSAKTQYEAEPEYFTFNVKVNKAGTFVLGTGYTLNYNNIEGKTSSRTFPDVTYTVSDILNKHGMFFKQNSGSLSTGQAGESYITTNEFTADSVAVNSGVSLGALINTKYAVGNVVIKVNAADEGTIKISEPKVKIYEVSTLDNSIKEATVKFEAPKVVKSGNGYIITFNPNLTNYGDKVYIINYNYKVNYSSSADKENFKPVDINNKFSVDGVDYKDYNYKVVEQPDAF